MVYRSPGKWPGPPGCTYDAIGVKDADELKAALAKGWHKTLPEACGLVKAEPAAPQAAPVAIPEDDAPPTRAELEEQARRLGIKTDGRWSDRKLAAAIADAMKG
jgi:hypothetical protein